MIPREHLRHALLAQGAQLTLPAIAAERSAIARYAGVSPAFLTSHTVMGYLALAQEVQTTSITADARHHQKRVVVPRIMRGALVAMVLPDNPEQLRRNQLGILEPSSPLATAPLEETSYIAIPGIAFDRQGGRLGYGEGYYDRFCRRLPPTTHRSGLAFSLQVVPHVPPEAHDIPMHRLITAQGAIPCVHSLPVVASSLGPIAHKGDPIVE